MLPVTITSALPVLPINAPTFCGMGCVIVSFFPSSSFLINASETVIVLKGYTASNTYLTALSTALPYFLPVLSIKPKGRILLNVSISSIVYLLASFDKGVDGITVFFTTASAGLEIISFVGL